MTSISTSKSTLKVAATPSNPRPELTEEGVAILDHIIKTDDNICIEAYAGCGKTTMLEYIDENSKQPTLYLAFNNSIVKEAGDKFVNADVSTFNGFGHRAWGKDRKLTLDPKTPKTPQLVRERLKLLKGDDADEAWDSYYDIVQALGMAKHLGYLPEGKFTDTKRLCDRQSLSQRTENKLSPLCWHILNDVLLTSIKTAFQGYIDFDDQIYMPALFPCSFPRYPLVLIDEDQDLSPSMYAMLHKFAKDRLVAVGDRWQSIYYFRGAETGAIDKLKPKYNMTELPLSISFRCPQAIVDAAKWRVPTLKAFKSGGRYAKLETFIPLDIPEGAAVICRNNAPLLRLAYNLLAEGRSVSIAGSDIGPKIIRLLQKIGAEGDSRDILLGKISDWRREKLEKTNSPDTIHDQAACLSLFAGWGQTLEQAVAYANRIFKEQGTITLTTGHKAKGREWEIVYHLDPQLCRDDEQDQNLRYVITTRAKHTLYEVKSNGND